MTAVVVVEAVVLLILSVLVVGLLRSYATVLRRLHELDGGLSQPRQQSLPTPEFRTSAGVVRPASRATGQDWPPGHDIVGVGLTGEIITVSVVSALNNTGQHTVLLFLSSGCAGCGPFWSDLARPERLPGRGSRLLVVAKDADAESPSLLRELCPAGIDLVLSSQAWADYQVPGSPYVMVVDGQSGLIRGEGSGTSLTQVSALIRQSSGDSPQAGASRPVRKPQADYERESDVDRALLAAGIGPGHPSLYAGPDGPHR